MIEVNAVDSRGDLEGRFLDAFEVHRSHLMNGHGEGLAETRDRAIRVFGELGFPGPKDEAWKYTPIRRVLENRSAVTIAPEPSSISSIDVEKYLIDDLSEHVAVLVNGALVPELSRIDQGEITVLPLLQALDNSAFRELFARRTEALAEVFSSLNTAFARHGLFVHAQTEKGETLHVVNLVRGDSDVLVQPRHLIAVDDESTLTVVETHFGDAEQRHFTNAVVECFVGARARLDYYRVQDDPGMSGVTSSLVHQKDSSYASCTTVTLSGGTIRNNVNVLPEAPFCESHLVGLFLGREDMHVDNHTLVDHAVPDCFSNELYKGILADRSKGVFNGKVLVRPDAQRTNAYQSNKSIILDESASMNAKPELEIYADDVKCSHGATTGRLDSEALFYLRSRGLSEQRARTILLLAFARDVLENIDNKSVRAWLDTKVEEYLA